MRKVYRSVDDVDTMIGLFAETPLKGFGFPTPHSGSSS
jgi:hypothetical protein